MNAYWAQFSADEIDSMHGVGPGELDEKDIDAIAAYFDEPELEECDEDEEEQAINDPRYCGCLACLDCLGMSESDFY
jgi:hypothetical protein